MSAPVLVMGILNVTPDSFSDGGRWTDATDAVAWGLRMFSEGADVVDVGGESTRPGATPVDLDEELHRVLPVVRALAPHGRVSIDTRHADVAEAAVSVGASIINDISSSLAEVAGFMGVGYVAMHMQGDPLTMQDAPHYDDVVAEVHGFLGERAEEARELGATEVWVDPGIGFGKTTEHNLALLAALPALAAAGTPVLVGASRKGFLGSLTGGAPVDDRLEASIAVATWAFAQGARMVRAHDVEPTVHAARLVNDNATTGATA